MKILYIIILGFCLNKVYSQDVKCKDTTGVFKIIKIETLKNCYKISALDNNGNKVLLLQDKLTKRKIKKLKSNYKSIIIDNLYDLELKCFSNDIGYVLDSKIVVDGITIWDSKTSDFDVYVCKNILDLYFTGNR